MKPLGKNTRNMWKKQAESFHVSGNSYAGEELRVLYSRVKTGNTKDVR